MSGTCSQQSIIQILEIDMSYTVETYFGRISSNHNFAPILNLLREKIDHHLGQRAEHVPSVPLAHAKWDSGD